MNQSQSVMVSLVFSFGRPESMKAMLEKDGDILTNQFILPSNEKVIVIENQQ
jgi:hypothetical protein